VEEGKPRRVSNVKVAGVALDPEKTYTVASHGYELLDNGDGYGEVFKDAVDITSEAKTDMEVLIEYVKSFGGKVPDEYKDPAGQGRINILAAPANTTSTSADIVPFEKRPIAA
jgi:hypothetical protein